MQTSLKNNFQALVLHTIYLLFFKCISLPIHQKLEHLELRNVRSKQQQSQISVSAK
jgi:hypothetical protein